MTQDFSEATHEEICDRALKHYKTISQACCEWCSTVEHAIMFYRRYGSNKEFRDDWIKVRGINSKETS